MQLFEPEQEKRQYPPFPTPTPEASNPHHQPQSESLSPAFKRGFGPVLENPRFLVLWLGQVFSQLADKIYLVLMIALIASRFQAPDQPISGWVSAIMIAFTIPAVLFGSLAGVFVDRWPKKDVLVLSNLLRGGAVLALPPLLWLSRDWGWLWGVPVGFLLLLVVTFFVSTLTQFFAPAEQAALPLIVKRQSLLPANSLYTTTMMALLIIGFAVGEPLLAAMDHLGTQLGWSFGKELLVGGAYAIAGMILLLLKTGEKRAALEIQRPHVFQDIWEGIQYLQAHHRVRNALIQLVILFSVFAALAVLAVPLAASIPSLKAEQFGFLLASAGLGMGLGAAFLGHWGQGFRNAQLSLWGSAGMALSLVGLSLFTHNLVLALLMTGFLGVFAALIGVPMQTTIQAETPEEMRGKVFGLQNNAINIALSLPLALAGVAESFWGLQTVLWVLAAFVVLGGILTWYIAQKGAIVPISGK
ncbi:MFS transporter [Spirulina subsalsa]|uniref:MFS transporter n=1 Tax=Spirulina subsalsa TaxID=54311 RepID=UPI0002E249A3|nr:MFS transporter [Spirulina subsalsa]